jgi:hypothetical protein
VAQSVNRNARTGKFTTASATKRNPSGTTTEQVGRGTSNKTVVHRSAETGQFVTKAQAKANPGTTISQRV